VEEIICEIEKLRGKYRKVVKKNINQKTRKEVDLQANVTVKEYQRGQYEKSSLLIFMNPALILSAISIFKAVGW